MTERPIEEWVSIFQSKPSFDQLEWSTNLFDWLELQASEESYDLFTTEREHEWTSYALWVLESGKAKYRNTYDCYDMKRVVSGSMRCEFCSSWTPTHFERDCKINGNHHYVDCVCGVFCDQCWKAFTSFCRNRNENPTDLIVTEWLAMKLSRGGAEYRRPEPLDKKYMTGIERNIERFGSPDCSITKNPKRFYKILGEHYLKLGGDQVLDQVREQRK